MVEWISDKYAMRKSQITAGREEVITQKKYIEFNYNADVFHSIMLSFYCFREQFWKNL